MTMVAPLALLHVKSTTLGATGVVAAGISGETLANTTVGLISAAAAIVGLVLAVAANNAKKKTAYAAEISAAEKRGSDSRNDEVARLKSELRDVRDEREFFRNQYAGLLQNRAGAPAVALPRPHDPDEGDE